MGYASIDPTSSSTYRSRVQIDDLLFDLKELAMGAIAAGGFEVLNGDLLDWLRISGHTIAEVGELELRELQRRERIYRGERPLPNIRDRTIVLVDDGLATGSTMRAAIGVLKHQQPQRLIIAISVAPIDDG